ncbi:MAG TPA: Type 1 glutamine amidotransferase-like domain-containing protein [Acidimicrobiia bacterium]|nr:Type 1 glutamine amidotransferase-like domain-containing protein [Acidimicrobiia bacterium]
MPGPIGLLGGLEHYEPATPLDRLLLEETGTMSPRVVVLPVASFRRQVPIAGELALSHWTRLGASVEVIMPTAGSDPRAVEAVKAADVIVLPGGVPNRLMQALGATFLWEEIVARWQAGAAVTGSSAGAMALFKERIALYPPDPFRLIPGLGLLEGYVAGPHFDRFRVDRWFRPVLRHLNPIGILGLDESTGLVGRDGAMRVLGTGSVTVARGDEIRAYPSGATIDLHLTRLVPAT